MAQNIVNWKKLLSCSKDNSNILWLVMQACERCLYSSLATDSIASRNNGI